MKMNLVLGAIVCLTTGSIGFTTLQVVCCSWSRGSYPVELSIADELV